MKEICINFLNHVIVAGGKKAFKFFFGHLL